MAGTTSKRSRAASIQKQAIDQVNVSLQELPEKPKDNLSLREAVSQLQDEIRAALAKGYSYDDLALMFAQKGIDISALTLKRYVSSGRSRAGKAKTPATRTRRPRQSKESSDTSNAAEPTETAKPGRRGAAAAKTRSTKATTTAEPKKTTGRSSSRASKSTSTTASKPASTRSRKRTTK